MGIGDRILETVHNRRAKDWYCIRYDTRRLYYNDAFTARRGRLNLAPHLLEWAASAVGDPQAVLIEPHIKGTTSGRNKDWGWSRWVQFAAASPVPLLQPRYGRPPRDVLPGVRAVSTPTFEHAAALLACARGIVTTCGALHTAAGALGKPAVVIFGGYARAQHLGYSFHENLEVDEPACLGRRQTDPACACAMERITVADVLAATRRAFP